MAKQIKMVLIDLSGTLHIDNTVIPGAVEALNSFEMLIYHINLSQIQVKNLATYYIID